MVNFIQRRTQWSVVRWIESRPFIYGGVQFLPEMRPFIYWGVQFLPEMEHWEEYLLKYSSSTPKGETPSDIPPQDPNKESCNFPTLGIKSSHEIAFRWHSLASSLLNQRTHALSSSSSRIPHVNAHHANDRRYCCSKEPSFCTSTNIIIIQIQKIPCHSETSKRRGRSWLGIRVFFFLWWRWWRRRLYVKQSPLQYHPLCSNRW